MKYGKSNHTEHRWSSVTEMMTDIDERHKSCECSSDTHDSGEKFYGGTIHKAREMLTTGWREGAVRVSNVRAELSEAVQKILNEKAAQVWYDVEGDWADAGRIATGEPECCGSFQYDGEDGGTKIIRIVMNLCVSGSVSHEAMFARGAATLAAVDILEAMGHRVQVDVGLGIDNYPKKKTLDLQFTVKDAGQPVDADRLAAVLCHPVFFRTVGFKWMQSFGANPCACYPGPIPSGGDNAGAIVLPELKQGHTPTHAEMVQQVISICRLCGIELDGSYV
jgi:hypothetical protein